MLREVDEPATVISGNPFLEMGAEENSLFVMFLADLPAAAAVAALDPQRSPGDIATAWMRPGYLLAAAKAPPTPS